MSRTSDVLPSKCVHVHFRKVPAVNGDLEVLVPVTDILPDKHAGVIWGKKGIAVNFVFIYVNSLAFKSIISLVYKYCKEEIRLTYLSYKPILHAQIRARART